MSEGDSVGNHCDIDKPGDICHTNKKSICECIDSFLMKPAVKQSNKK